MAGNEYLNAPDQERLLALLLGARTVVVEREYIDKDFRNVYAAYYSTKFAQSSSRAVRWHLFDVEIPADVVFGGGSSRALADWLEAHPPARGRPDAPGSTPGYLGYLVLRPTEYSRIGRCLLDPRRASWSHLRGGQCLLVGFSANMMGHCLHVKSFPHQSQDGEAHLCGHTAIWGLFRYLSQRYPTYPERYPYDIARLNTDLQYGRSTPGHGLYMSQVTAMIGQLGIGAEAYDAKNLAGLMPQGPATRGNWASPAPLIGKKDNAAVQRELTHLMAVCLESGIPAIVGVPHHAVVAVGSKYDRQTPSVLRSGRMLRSSDFLSGVIVNDDNRAPFQLATWHLGTQGTYERSCQDFDSLVVPLPDKVLLRPEVAEVMTTDLLNQMGPPSRATKFVRRQFCTSSKNYKSDRRTAADAFTRQLLQMPLPHFVWVTEVSTRGAWQSGGQVVAEVGLDASAGPFDEAAYLWIRYPQLLVLNTSRMFGVEHSSGQTRKSFVDNDLRLDAFVGNLSRI